MTPRVGVVVPAAGSGQRMGGAAKTFLELAGRPVLLRALDPFLAHPEVEAVVVALSPSDAGAPPGWLVDADPRIRVTAGGGTRSHSVHHALEALPPGLEVVAVHDGARPLVDPTVVDACLQTASRGVGGVAGHPAVDTMKQVGVGGEVLGTPLRSSLWHAQTPQAFPAPELIQAYRRAVVEGWEATDDAEVFARAGGRVEMVASSPTNLKVTHPQDLELALAILGAAGSRGELGE